MQKSYYLQHFQLTNFVKDQQKTRADSDLNYNNLDQYEFITASATKNSQSSAVGRVDIHLSPKALGNLLSVEKNI